MLSPGFTVDAMHRYIKQYRPGPKTLTNCHGTVSHVSTSKRQVHLTRSMTSTRRWCRTVTDGLQVAQPAGPSLVTRNLPSWCLINDSILTYSYNATNKILFFKIIDSGSHAIKTLIQCFDTFKVIMMNLRKCVLFIFANFEMKVNKRRHNWIVLENSHS